MAGYSARQSTFTTGDTITAAHSNDEFNQILAAFHVSTGHTHDGTTAGDGGPLSTLFSNTISMGTGADTDIAVTFNANSNDGVITWMEDEDYFQFSDDLLLSTTEKIQFRDTAIYINSSTDGQLDLVADTEIQIAATTVDINGNVDISGSLTLGGTAITSTAEELNILDGVTSTTAELNILDGVTSTAAELNIMDGDTSATSTTVADADRVVYNDAGTMKQVAVTDLDTYISATSKTLTNKTLTSPVLNTGVSGTAIADEDDMSSNSATKLATQQSIKAYVDAQITAEDLDVTTDSGTIAIDLDSETLTIAGGTGLDSSATSNTVTLAIDSTVATLTGSQTLTNKTLTNPVLNTGVSGTAVLDEDNMASDSATQLATQQSIKAYVDAVSTGITTFVMEDDDGTEVTISDGKEVKFIGSGLTTNWTDTDNGTDGDPYDLTFTVDAAQTGITSILATDLKIGEDDQTKIDFETADEIHFYAANAEQVYVADGVFGPQTDSDVDLGTTGVRWKDAYVDSVTVTDNLTVGGDLTVNGTTTTVNSTTVTIDDPIFTLGGDTAPGSDDNKDRGIEFRWHNGSDAKVGFFGYDDSASAFTFIPDATNSSEVFSGTVGNVAFGDIAGTLTTAAQTNITSVGALDGGSITSGFGAIDVGSSAITTTGTVTGGTLSGTLSTAAQTNITSTGALDGGSITSGFGAIDTGSSTITTTGLISGGSLDIDDVLINGTTIGHTDDTDLMTLASGALTVAGTIEGTTITASTAVVPNASGGADLGTSSLEWGDLYIADDKKIYLGSDQDVSIEYDEDGNDTTAVVAAGGVSMAPHGTGTGNTTELRFQELAANGANYVGFKGPDAIASNEVWTLPNTDGTSGQFLTTDGSNALSWGDAGGGGTVDMVADGAIAIRKPVILTAAGKAKQVAFADAAAGVGTIKEIDSTVNGSNNRTNLVYMDGVGSGVKTFVKIYLDGGNSNYITAVAITINDIGDRTVSVGTPVAINSRTTSYMDAVFDPDTDRVIMVYENGDDNDKPYYSVISVSGTTLTSSAVAVVDDDANLNADEVALSYDTSADRVALVFKDNNFSASDRTKIASYVGTVTGGTTNSVAWGSKVYADPSTDKSNSRTRICYDAGTNRHLLIYTDSDGLQSRVGTLTGASTNTLAWGDQTTLHTAFAQYDVAVTYEATQAKCVVSFSNGSTTQSLGVVTVTGSSTNTAAIGSLVTVTRDDAAGAPNSNAISAIAASKVGYVYNVSDTVKVTPFTISGTSLSAGTAVTIASANTANTQIAGVVATGAAAVSFETNNVSINVVEYRSATISGGGSTPLTRDNYLGVSKAAISDGATGKIVIPGGISDGHSSLTPGSRYFTNGAGTIGLAGDSGGLQFLGRAVSATEIQLQEEEFNFYAEADGDVTEGNPIELTGGKIKEIVGSVIASSEYSQPEDTASTDGEKNAILYDPDTQRIVAIYYGPSSNRLKGAVGVLTGGTTNSISWGTPVVIESTYIPFRLDAAYDETADRVVVAYGGNDGTNWVGASRVLQITGGTDNTITVGSSASFGTGTGYQQKEIQCTYDPDVGKVFATYFEENLSTYTSSRTYGAVATVTPGTNTVSWGSQSVAGTSGSTHQHTPSTNIYNPDVNKGFFIYRDDADTDRLKINMMNISSSSISFDGGTDHNPNSITSTNYPRSTYDTERDRILTVYTRSGNVYAVSTSVSVDGNNNETYSSAAEFAITTNGSSQSGTSYNQTNMVYNPTDGIHLLIYNDGDNNNYASAIELTVAADGTVSKGVRSVVSSDTPWSSTNVMYEPNANRYVAIKENSDNRTAIIVMTGSVDTTKTNFDGFAQITASDGNATAAKIDFEIDDNQTELTAGTTYYLDSNTDITATSTDNQKVGVAISDTELQIVKT